MFYNITAQMESTLSFIDSVHYLGQKTPTTAILEQLTLAELPFDIKLEIASKQEDAWYKMYHCDVDFHNFAQSIDGRNLFIKLFTVVVERTKKTTEYRLFGKINSVDDRPSIVSANGSMSWNRNGVLHRDNDLPAIVYPDGSMFWWQNGKQHRDNDRPASIRSDGAQHWYVYNMLHRDGDQPAVILPSGEMRWYKNNRLHRDGGMPAIITPSGRKFWYKHGSVCFSSSQS